MFSGFLGKKLASLKAVVFEVEEVLLKIVYGF